MAASWQPGDAVTELNAMFRVIGFAQNDMDSVIKIVEKLKTRSVTTVVQRRRELAA